MIFDFRINQVWRPMLWFWFSDIRSDDDTYATMDSPHVGVSTCVETCGILHKLHDATCQISEGCVDWLHWSCRIGHGIIGHGTIGHGTIYGHGTVIGNNRRWKRKTLKACIQWICLKWHVTKNNK